MKKITEAYLNEHIKRAAKNLTPHRALEIWEQPAERAKGDEWYLDGTKPKKRSSGKVIALISSIAACLAVCFLSLYMVNIRVESTVYLDVNPSVMLRVNCNDKVISAEAGNSDGEVILEDMDLKNTDLDVAVNALLGSMVKHGYLSEAKDVILLSVDSGSTEKSEALRAQLSDEINECLTSLLGSCAVFDQEVKDDDRLEKLAGKYGITIGKASLLQKITDEYPQLDYSVLAKMSMKDLAQYLAQEGIDLRSFANFTGTYSDKTAETKDTNSADSDLYQDREEEQEDDRPDLYEDDDAEAEAENYSAYEETYASDGESVDDATDGEEPEDDLDDDPADDNDNDYDEDTDDD